MSQRNQRPDPAGSPLDGRQGLALEEADRLLALVESHLRHMGLAEIELGVVRAELAAKRREVTGSGSRLPPGPRRYKSKRSHSRRRRPGTDWLLFIDESGSWQPATDSVQDDWFALGAVAMTRDATSRYEANADAIKMAFFDSPFVTLHEPEMRRREAQFNFGGNEAKRIGFEAAVNHLVSEAEFAAFAVGIRKRALADGATDLPEISHLPLLPYPLALHLLLERFVDYLAYLPGRPRASIIMESQQSHLDALHQLTVAETIAYGTRYVSSRGFQNFLNPGVSFVENEAPIPPNSQTCWLGTCLSGFEATAWLIRLDGICFGRSSIGAVTLDKASLD